MATEILKRDDDRVTVLGGITDDSNAFITQLRVDPVTGRLKVSASVASFTTLFTTDTSTSTASQTSITSSKTINSVILLSIAGQVWSPVNDYTTSGTTVTLLTAIPGGEEIVLVYL